MCRFASSLVHADRACVLRWPGEGYAIVGRFGEGIDESIALSGFDLEHRAERLSSLVGDERRVQRLIDGPGYVVTPLSQTSAGPGQSSHAFLRGGRAH